MILFNNYYLLTRVKKFPTYCSTYIPHAVPLASENYSFNHSAKGKDNRFTYPSFSVFFREKSAKYFHLEIILSKT